MVNDNGVGIGAVEFGVMPEKAKAMVSTSFSNLWKLTDRDVEFMRVVYEEQGLRVKAISEHFFNGSIQAASNRITDLLDRGLVKFETLKLPGRIRILKLTGKGVQAMGDNLKFKVRQKARIPIATIEHDNLVADIRLHIKKYFSAPWVPYSVLKGASKKHAPDGLLVFPNNKKMAVVVESKSKSTDRYNEMWREWEGYDFFIVLYITSNKQVQKSIQKRLKEFKTRSMQFGLVSSSEIMTGTAKDLWTPLGDFPFFKKREI